MAHAGHHAALDELVANQRWLRRLAVSIAGDPARAEDLEQATWEAAGRQEPPPRAAPRAWLRGILRNQWRMRARADERRARREAEAAVATADDLSTEDLYARAEIYGLLCELVAALDEPYRTTILLRYAEDLTTGQIADRIDVSASTVRVRLHRAHAQLRAGLERRLGKRRTWAVLGTFVAKGGAVKVGGKAVSMAIVLLLLLAGGGVTMWYLQSGRSRDATPARADKGNAGGTSAQGTTGETSQEALATWFGEPDRPRARIAGRVTFAGNPVAAARVALTSAATRTGAIQPTVVVTDDDGAFDFGERRAAVYDVTALADAKGYGTARTDTRGPTSNPESDALMIRLSGCEHALYGVIRDASGGVVAHAEVFPTRGMWMQTTELGLAFLADERGAYEFCTSPGMIGATVRAQGYGSVTIWETVVGRHSRDVELVPEATVVGRVVRVPTGEAVPEARVQLINTGRGRVRSTYETTTSGPDGRFRFQQVAPGRHFLSAEAEAAYSNTTPVVATPAEESREVILRVEPAGSLSGTVVGADGPISWARVGLVIGGRRWDAEDFVVADGEGKFSISPAPLVSLGFVVEGYRVESPDAYDAKLGERAPVVVRVARSGEIRGRVLYRDNPVEGAEVTASGGPGGRPAETRSNEDGTFAFVGLDKGTYTLSAYSYALGALSTEATSPRVELGEREMRDDVVIRLDAEASIAGTVEDQDGNPVPRMVVRYLSPEIVDGCDATTDENGAFHCRMLAGASTYEPTVLAGTLSSIHFPPADADSLPAVSVPNKDSHVTGQRLSVRIASATIRGRVVTQSGGPYPDVSVFATPATSKQTPANAPFLGFPTGISDADGAFTVAVWTDVTYNLHALAPGGAEAVQNDVDAGESGVILRLEESGGVRGTLVGFDESPDILVRRMGDTMEATPASLDGDSFSLDGLAPGKYAVFAVAGSQGDAKPVVVRPGEVTRLQLEARERARVRVRVSDFLTGDPVAGVHCTSAPRVPGAPLWGWACPRGVPSNAEGILEMEAPSGPIVIVCDARREIHSDGKTRLDLEAGKDNSAEVKVVVSETPEDYGHSIGARFPVLGDAHVIVALRPGGAAEQAGLRVGDAIAAVNGKDVTMLTEAGLLRLFATFAVGTKLEIDFLRNGQGRRTVVAVEPQPPWSW